MDPTRAGDGGPLQGEASGAGPELTREYRAPYVLPRLPGTEGTR